MKQVETWHAASRLRGWRIAACGLAAATALAGCASLGLGGSDPAPAPTAESTPPSSQPASSNSSFTTRVKSFFAGDSGTLVASSKPAAGGAPAAPQIDCPPVQYRLGAATLSVNAPGVETSALSLRYQGSFTQTARECIVRGSELTIKVGVQGRIVVGPAGGPGTVQIPLRYALVREGLEPKVLWTKLFVFPVVIPEANLNVPFIHIEEDMTVPIPSAAEADAYVIYIGFDADGATPAKPAPKPRTARSK